MGCDNSSQDEITSPRGKSDAYYLDHPYKMQDEHGEQEDDHDLDKSSLNNFSKFRSIKEKPYASFYKDQPSDDIKEESKEKEMLQLEPERLKLPLFPYEQSGYLNVPTDLATITTQDVVW